MNNDKDKIKYFAYVRKSTEGEERQALSIPAQMDKLKEIFGHLDIEFVEDKASAFKPFNRPNFAKMLERIKKGERTGLIAWHPDRLSRNEKDAGEITYMVRHGVVADLKLATYHFENTPEGIWMLQMALSQSQYESAKKGRDVKRGLAQSAKMGFYPAPAPLGYLDDKYSERGKKKKLPDPDTFDLTRKMFDMMLSGEYTPQRIRNIVNETWGLRGSYGKKMSRSGIYNLLTRSFYYGEFEYPANSGNIYVGNHKPMITRDEYDTIQIMLGRKNPQKITQREMLYRGPMTCGECGAMITAEEKVKRPKNGKVHHYTYYHCTKRKDPNCSQKSIEEKELERQIAEELGKIEIPPDFKDWALARLKTQNSHEVEDRERIYNLQRHDYDACVKKIDNLIDMRANQEITEEEFKNRKQALLVEKARFQELLKDTDKRIENWLEIAERGFNFAEKAFEIFQNKEDLNSLKTKKEIFASLGSNLILKDRKLSICWDELLFPIKQISAEVREINKGLEPVNNADIAMNNGDKYSQSPRVLRDLGSNQDTGLQRPMSYH